MDQDIRFVTTRDGKRLAYATVGQGRPLVMPAVWVSHLEFDWSDPLRRQFFESLASRYTVIRYDRLGCGLSDRERDDFTIDLDLRHLEDLIDSLGLKQCSLFGLSFGGPLSVLYAARHPESVDKIVLYGTFAHLDAEEMPVRKALVDLIRANWGLGSEALAHRFYAGADSDTHARFARLQREACTGEMAARLYDMARHFDVAPQAETLQRPTLVIHRRDDAALSFRFGRELAALIPRARFLPLEGAIHAPWAEPEPVLQAMDAFLSPLEEREADQEATVLQEKHSKASGETKLTHLTARELEVLHLISRGFTNQQIANELVISTHTVGHHVGRILDKLEVENRASAISYAHEHE